MHDTHGYIRLIKIPLNFSLDHLRKTKSNFIIVNTECLRLHPPLPLKYNLMT